jgi:predicted transcriptional regulator of viral defense system
MKLATKRDIVDREARSKGVLRAADVLPLGVTDSYLRYLVRQGHLERAGRGLFVLPDYPYTENHGLVEVAAYAPRCVICLLSALQFHGLGTQMPPAIWVAVANHAHPPKVPTVLIETVHMGPASLSAGVETHMLEGVLVRIFSAAKTVVDCFKFRSSVGIDVALESLKDGLARRKFTPADLYDYAVIDRVWEVMLRYLEALQ